MWVGHRWPKYDPQCRACLNLALTIWYVKSSLNHVLPFPLQWSKLIGLDVDSYISFKIVSIKLVLVPPVVHSTPIMYSPKTNKKGGKLKTQVINPLWKKFLSPYPSNSSSIFLLDVNFENLTIGLNVFIISSMLTKFQEDQRLIVMSLIKCLIFKFLFSKSMLKKKVYWLNS